MELGIVPCRIGGIGNQIFIVVAGYISAKVNKVPLYVFNMKWKKHQHSVDDYTKSLFSKFGQVLGDDQDTMPSAFSSYIKHSQCGFSSWNPHTIKPGTLLTSYYQYYPTIAPYEDEIRELLLDGLSAHRSNLKESYPDNYAFLHIRRGDYLACSHIHYIQPLEYFQKAVSHLSTSATILVFSDDIQWVLTQDYFKDCRFKVVSGLNEVETLSLMTLCTEGAICSNSTFSWWGAFLGTYAARNPVIVPERWINTAYFNTEEWINGKVPNMFPKEWVVLST